MEQNEGILTPNYLKEYINHISAIVIQSKLRQLCKKQIIEIFGD